jgi:hypothetical protein
MENGRVCRRFRTESIVSAGLALTPASRFPFRQWSVGPAGFNLSLTPQSGITLHFYVSIAIKKFLSQLPYLAWPPPNLFRPPPPITPLTLQDTFWN